MKLIRNAHVCAPEDCGIQNVLICNDKILAVRKDLEPVWEDTEVIEAEGRILIPGLIDQHVHIIGGGGEDGFASLIPPVRTRDCVQYGVTSVIGLLGTDGHAKSVEALVAKTKALKEEGMSAWCLTGSYAYPSVTLTGSPARDVVFIEEVLGVKIAISDHRSSNVSEEELARLVSQVRTAGLLAHKPGIVHLHTGRGKEGLKQLIHIVQNTDIPVTQFRPTHCGNCPEDAIAFAKMGGIIDFTAGDHAAETIHRVMREVPAAQITLSSDSNGSFPKWSEDKKLIGLGIGKPETLLTTVRDLVRKETVSFCDALSLVTSNVAEAMMLTGKGRIREGYDADLVLLDNEMQATDVWCRGQDMVRNYTVTVKEKYTV